MKISFKIHSLTHKSVLVPYICIHMHVSLSPPIFALSQCCIQLAQGKLTPEQLTEGVLSLVSTRPPRHLSDSSYSFEDSGQGRPSAEIIRMMSKLSDRAKYAQQCCDCIMTCFRLALVSVVHSTPE